MSLFATKPLSRILAESEEGDHKLKRTLTATQLTALGIGAIIGAGLFSLTGPAAANHAGPAIMLSFVVAAIGCAFAGLCYSEFSTMIPVAGSAYTYSYATMGELFAWVIGWDLVLEYAVGASTVATSWSRYFVSLLKDFGIHFPMEWAAGPFESVQLPPLERGVVDGYGWPILGIFDLGWEKGTKFRVEPSFYSTEVNVLVNLDVWKGLTDAQRKVLNDAALWLEGLDRENEGLMKAEIERQTAAGIQPLNFGPAESKRFVDMAYEVGWRALIKRSPENGPKLRQLAGN